VLLSIRDYVRLAAPEPEVFRIIGEESRKKRTDKRSDYFFADHTTLILQTRFIVLLCLRVREDAS